MNNFNQLEAGLALVQRNTFYEPIKVWDAAPPAFPQGGTESPSNKSKVLEDNLATA